MGKYYTESEGYGNGYRKRYLNGLEKLLEQRTKDCQKRRDEFGKAIISDQEYYRKKLRDMLGWPLNEKPKTILSVTEQKTFENDKVIIRRMQFELFDGFYFYGILIRHKTDKKLPLVISQHGGLGTPEICCSFFDSANYKDMSERIFDKGVNVFAPQLDLWQEERFGPSGKRNDFDMKLKQLGGSIAALEIYSVMRCIDYFEKADYCNGKFGMSGLSYGGFYTMYTAAVDTRIKAALSCSHFNDRIKYGWMSKSFKNAASTFLDAEVAALVYPRRLAIEVGDNDDIFDIDSALAEYERFKKLFGEKEKNFRFHVFKGTHEFCPDNDDAINWILSELL